MCGNDYLFFEGAVAIKTKQNLCFHSVAYLKPNFYIGIVNKTKFISIKNRLILYVLKLIELEF